MEQDPSIPGVLAAAFLAGEPVAGPAAERGGRALGRSWGWIAPVARRYADAFQDRASSRHRDVVEFLLADRGFLHAWRNFRLEAKPLIAGPPHMQPAKPWNVPAITTACDLAERFSLGPTELDWFADPGGYQLRQHNPRLDHYHYRVLAKPGSIRLIEAPKRRMKALQRRILDDILAHVPAHDAAHGFVAGRSIKTFSAPHVDQRVVLRMDLSGFFPSIRRSRVQALFRTIGYPEHVADLLGGVCTTATPRRAWRGATGDPNLIHEARALYVSPHLPQGAPTSPALANLIGYRFDCRLTGLAASAGAVYTRYADDLAFSGGEDFDRRVERFSTHVAAILDEEGFAVHHRKTRIMRRGVRQYLAGVVVNSHPNVPRLDFDLLKAILTNCARYGPETQNRERHPDFRLHLSGRVSFVEMIHPGRGAKLRALFDEIRWDTA